MHLANLSTWKVLQWPRQNPFTLDHVVLAWQVNSFHENGDRAHVRQSRRSVESVNLLPDLHSTVKVVGVLVPHWPHCPPCIKTAILGASSVRGEQQRQLEKHLELSEDRERGHEARYWNVHRSVLAPLSLSLLHTTATLSKEGGNPEQWLVPSRTEQNNTSP